MATVSTFQFASALNALDKVGRPGGKQLQFLQAHYWAPDGAATATALAKKVHYSSYGAINLRYGILAAKIGEYLGNPGADIRLLVDLVAPPSVTNKQWILVMRPEFADALKRAGWIR